MASGGWRRRGRRALLVLLLALAWPLVEAGRTLLWRAPAAAHLPADGHTRLLVGTHLHSDAAGGTGPLSAIVAAARRASLDAVWITDHDTYALLDAQGWHGEVLVLVGCERDTDRGHLLSLTRRRPPFPLSRESEEAARDSRAIGGVGLAAHPFRRGSSKLRWSGDLDALDGIEIINLDAAVRESLWRWPRALLAGAPFTGRSLAAAAGPELAARALWDRALARRMAIATGTADAHGILASYATALATVANVVLLDAPLGGTERDLDAVATAVARGRLLVAWTAVADPRGASFLGRSGGQLYLPGDVAPEGSRLDLELHSGLAVEAELRIVHRGAVVARGRGRSLHFAGSEPGAYRGEIDVLGAPHAPWLIANAIGIAGSGWPLARSEVAGQPVPMVPSTASRPLLAGLTAEHDARSRMEVGREGGALHLSWSLGLPDEHHPEVWVALVDRGADRSLARYRHLVFEAESDAPARWNIGFTLDDGARVLRSLRIDARRQTFRLPLASFFGQRPVAPVVNFLATVDRSCAWPGASGSLRIYALFLE